MAIITEAGPDPRTGLVARVARGGADWAATTRGSSSPPDPPAPRRVLRSPTATPRRSSTPRRECSCRTIRSDPATGCWPVCRWRSTRRVRRCGWPGGTAACLVPAPRSLVRSGMDLGPWLVSRDITVVSTVPTLAALWPAEALEAVRLLIFGGEACPPELAERLAVEGREVWNTYGPTEATVVACAARLDGTGPVSIGLPLPGWDLAVVDKNGVPVGSGEVGELVIGGVGLARYLDPDKDAEKYAPMPTLEWSRAYRSGDLVRLEPDGLYLHRPGRRPGEGRRPPDRARRGRLGAGESARRQRRRGGGAAHGQRHPTAGRLCREHGPVVRCGEGPRHAGRDAARRLGAAPGPSRRTPHPHIRQGRPRRAALATAWRDRAGCCGRPGRHDGLAGRAVARRARRTRRRSGGRLLRPRWRIAVRRAARRRVAAALSPGHGRRPVRPSPARLVGRIPRRARSAAGGHRPGW